MARGGAELFLYCSNQFVVGLANPRVVTFSCLSRERQEVIAFLFTDEDLIEYSLYVGSEPISDTVRVSDLVL